MKTRTLALLATVGALMFVGTAPAHAYDQKAYSYAAGHMIHRAAIPAMLGSFSSAMAFNAYEPEDPTWMCSLLQPGNVPATEINFPAGRYEFNANYSVPGPNSPALTVYVYQYTSASKAISAFGAAKRQAKRCTGTYSDSWTDSSAGVVSTYTTVTTNGVVPAVAIAGVKSVFVNVDTNAATTGTGPFQSDQYQVFSLINDVVIVTSYNQNSSDNVTTQQRKAVDQVAFNAETAWLH
jgi:hypothetical protein